MYSLEFLQFIYLKVHVWFVEKLIEMHVKNSLGWSKTAYFHESNVIKLLKRRSVYCIHNSIRPLFILCLQIFLL
jgi:hypothetical protein